MPAVTTGARRAAAAQPPSRRAGARREARLLPEHAERYPGLVPGQWESAAVLADRVLASRLLQGRELVLPGRILADGHFEFRGGDARGAIPQARPRREDR
jgi:hypothetical protein